MDELTPGKKLILDLLAKSIAKVQAAEAKNQDAKTDVEIKDKKSHKSSKKQVQEDEVKIEEKENVTRKVKKERKHIKEEKRRAFKREEVVGNKTCVEDHSNHKAMNILLHKSACCKVEPIQVVTEYTEIKTEEMDAEIESRSFVKVEAEKDAKTHFEKRYDSSTGKVEKVEIKTEEKENDKWKDKKYKKDKKERKQIKKENSRALKQENMNIQLPKRAKAETLEIETELREIEKVELDHKELKYNKKKVFKELNKKKRVLKEFDSADSNKTPKSKHYRKSTSGKGNKRFTPEEDAILLQAMERSGGKVNFQEISKDIPGRHPSSIINRVYLLKKTGNTRKKYTFFTLTEDLVTLDAVLKHLDEQTLEDLNLPYADWVEVAEQIGRERFAPRKRWEYRLKPWILQHYSGTLNLDIKRPLANFLSKHFKDVNSIDWPSVISKPLFAGHTEVSLRSRLSELMMSTKRYQSEGSEVITLEMIAEFANTKYVLGERKVSETELKRQKEIIDHFECYVKMNDIKNFL